MGYKQTPEHKEKLRQSWKANRQNHKPRRKGRYGSKKYPVGPDDPSYGKTVRLRLNYNLDINLFNSMFEEQEGRCAICKKHHSELKRPLSLDHCHTTLKVRGLLCNNCNVGLGYFKDNTDLLEKAIDYLRK